MLLNYILNLLNCPNSYIIYIMIPQRLLCCLEPQFSSALEPSPTQFGSLADATPTSASILLTEEQKASLIHQVVILNLIRNRKLL